MPDRSSFAPAPSLEIAKAFWTLYTGDPNAPIRLRLIHPVRRRERGSDGKLYPVNPAKEMEGTLDDLWPAVCEYQAREYSVYFFPNLVTAGIARTASDDDVSEARALFVDCDGGLPESWHVDPDLVVATSKIVSAEDGREIQKGAAYWLLSDGKVGEFRTLQTRLAEHYDSDRRVVNPSRVMRLPGSIHRKPAVATDELKRLLQDGQPVPLTAPQLVTFADRTGGMGRDFANPSATIMAGIAELSRSVEHAKLTAPEGIELDRPWNIDKARHYLRELVKRGDVAVEGQGGNSRAYEVMAAVAEMGLSIPKMVELVGEKWNPHCVPPFDDEELLTLATNAAHPKAGGKYGHNEPGSRGDPDPAQWEPYIAAAGGPAQQSTQDGFEIPAGSTQKPSNPRIKLMTLEEVDAQPDPVDLVDGLLVDRENVAIVGVPKSGKSHLALDIALSIAAGVPVLGKYPVKRQGYVAYLSGEGHPGMKKRVRAWRREHGITGPLPFFYNRGVPKTGATTDNVLREAQEFIEAVKEAVAAKGGELVLVVIDTMARSIGGLSENDSSTAALYLELTETLRTGLDCTTLTLAHASNRDTKGPIHLRGSSGFDAGFDSLWILQKNDENKTVTLYADQLKEADPDDRPDICFRLVKTAEGAVLQHVDTAPGAKKPDPAVAKREDLRLQMRTFGVVGYQNALTDLELAEKLAGPQPPSNGPTEEVSNWYGRRDDLLKDLQSGAKSHGKGQNGNPRPPVYRGLFHKGMDPRALEQALGRTVLHRQPGTRGPAPVLRIWYLTENDAGFDAPAAA